MFEIIYQSLCFLRPYDLNYFGVVSTNESLTNINALFFIMEGGGGRERAYFLWVFKIMFLCKIRVASVLKFFTIKEITNSLMKVLIYTMICLENVSWQYQEGSNHF